MWLWWRSSLGAGVNTLIWSRGICQHTWVTKTAGNVFTLKFLAVRSTYSLWLWLTDEFPLTLWFPAVPAGRIVKRQKTRSVRLWRGDFRKGKGSGYCELERRRRIGLRPPAGRPAGRPGSCILCCGNPRRWRARYICCFVCMCRWGSARWIFALWRIALWDSKQQIGYRKKYGVEKMVVTAKWDKRS